jgi:hypothetical protein
MTEHGYQLFAINIYSVTFVNLKAAAEHLRIPRVAKLREATERASHAS